MEDQHNFFIRRLNEIGLYDKDSEYSGLIGKSVEELSKVFSTQGHYGRSAIITLGVFRQLLKEWDQ